MSYRFFYVSTNSTLYFGGRLLDISLTKARLPAANLSSHRHRSWPKSADSRNTLKSSNSSANRASSSFPLRSRLSTRSYSILVTVSMQCERLGSSSISIILQAIYIHYTVFPVVRPDFLFPLVQDIVNKHI